MNSQFQSWFSEGKAIDALCGLGSFFMPDVTYREEHDYVLAVGELLEWASDGHREDAAEAFDGATKRLLDMGHFEDALRLLRSYVVLTMETRALLPINESLLASSFNQAAREAAERLSQDEKLRNLLLSVSGDFPPLKRAIGLNLNELK